MLIPLRTPRVIRLIVIDVLRVDVVRCSKWNMVGVK